MSEHPVSTLNKPDVALEMTLRPSLFSDFTGQPKVKERLEIAVETPTRLSGRQRELLEEFRATETGEECPQSSGFFQKLKDALAG